MDTRTKDTLDYYCPIFKEIIEYIEVSISKKNYSEISLGLETKYGPRYDSIRVIFGKYMPSSLKKYIKRRILTNGYLKAQIEDPVLNRRSTYFGLPGFIEKFESEFGVPFKKGLSESDLQEVYDIDEIISWHSLLSGKSFIDDYKLTPFGIKIRANDYLVLKGFLSFDAYLLPVFLSDFFSTLNDHEKMMFLEAIAVLANGDCEKVTISKTMWEESEYKCKLYDFLVRNRIGNYYIFTPEVPEYLYDIYCDKLAELIPNIYVSIPRQQVSHSTDNELTIIGDSYALNDICTRLGLTKEQATTLIWRYLKIGYLRVKIQ